MAGGAWRAGTRWARADLRRRWATGVVLGVLAGLTAGLALAALTGSIRSGDALERLRARAHGADAIVFSSQVGASHPDWARLAARPEVRTVAPWALVFGRLGGDPEGIVFTAVDGTWLHDVDRPIVLSGRMPADDADEEVVIGDRAASAYGIHVGDEVPFTPYTPQENVRTDETPAADADLEGPDLTLRVVGIVRTPAEALFVEDGLLMAPPGLIRNHPEVDFHENAMVQLRGRSPLAALSEHVSADVAPGAPVLDLDTTARRVTTSTDVERAALALLAATIALAALVLVGQVLVRSASAIGDDARVLSAMGMRRSAMATSAAIAHAPAAAIAAAVTVATGVVTSRWLPLGQAARVEPDRGLRIDGPLLAAGAVLVPLLVLGAAWATGWLVAGRQRLGGAEPPRGAAEWIRRHAAPAVGIGATLALRRGRGPRGLPVRAALAGAIVGVLGVTGALTLDHGLRDALAHPERAGVAWEGQARPGREDAFTDTGFSAAFVTAMRAVPDQRDAAQVDRVAIPVGTGSGVPAFSVRPLGSGRTGIQLVTLDGRAPDRPGEVAVGPATMDALHLHLGDRVEVGNAPDRRRLRVVGTALFPTDVHAGFDEGVWLSPADYDHVMRSDESRERYVVMRFAPGRTRAGIEAMGAAAGRFDGGALAAEVPPEILHLRGVRPLPRLLAGLLGVLALAALLHVLLTTTRVRAGDFAVLRALGFTRRSSRLVVFVQALVVFAVGLLFGVPLGLATGRIGWSEIASRVPLAEVSPITWLAVAVVVPTTLVVSQVLAAGPGRRIGRLRPGEVLRSE